LGRAKEESDFKDMPFLEWQIRDAITITDHHRKRYWRRSGAKSLAPDD